MVTADHGMAPQDVELAANPGRHVKTIGLAAEVADSMIWLLDCHLELERSADRRTARIIVTHGDALASGERPALADAQVEVYRRGNGGTEEELARGTSDAHGLFAFATPAEILSSEILLRVRATGCTPRNLALDGLPLHEDLRRSLYPEHLGLPEHR